MPGRRGEVLDAAVKVLGTGGLRGLTYQAVDTAAGVPAGTTSNHFRSRALLVTGVVAHLEALDARDWKRFAAAPAGGGPDALADALTRTVRHVLGPGRHRTAARYALALEGIVRPEVREPLSRAREAMIELTSAWLAEAGSPVPREHCRILFDYLDGLIFHQVATPEPDFDPAPGIRTVLTAFLPPTAPNERA
ncbi:TetR family transcriptional regulator [Streptomyces sp. WAC 06738]|uniref:TetR/AcrR family transcriptional regulator n=1 Tax=Streptomyces sp. WAC 06738 TaxID=2203210 RepID=UPI000F713097|nr:TetR/AcrR family transcriptional regulator [Streptomyces sp. WAC 06738]AZM49820.1 TetR family transcriptional regulator [Streptomyces sp. WAC 06738]